MCVTQLTFFFPMHSVVWTWLKTTQEQAAEGQTNAINTFN